jgi:DNA mismatch repair protein MutL
MEKNVNKIIQLDKGLAAKIAAGEVVQNPLSVVKELVENAIDAGASSIEIHIFGAGIERIEIIDDGCGIKKEDLELAFCKHATSKLAGKTDLDEISSLGFRGEALYSIKTVAKVRLVSKTSEDQTATAIVFDGEENGSVEPARGETGTTVIVEDLFYNTPARRKFLKSEKTELNRINDFLARIAISCPGVRFSYFSNGKKCFSSRGDGELDSALISLLGADIFKDLVYTQKSVSSSEVASDKSHEPYDIRVRAYVSKQGRTTKNKTSQVFYVNGRSVLDMTISRAIARAYEGFIMPNHFPIAYVFVDIPASKVDVNVHPQKTNIRFADDKAVFSAIRQTIRDKLFDGTAIGGGMPEKPGTRTTQTTTPTSVPNNAMQIQNAKTPATVLAQEDGVRRLASTQTYANKAMQALKNTSALNRASSDGGAVPVFSMEELLPPKTEIVSDLSEPEITAAPEMEEAVKACQPLEDVPRNNESASEQTQLSINTLAFIGNIFATYLLFKDENDLYIVDQHAAHERINYEKLKSRATETIAGQNLIAPESLEMPPAKSNSFFEKLESLESLGFEIELMSAHSIYIRAIPIIFNIDQAISFLKEIIFAEGSEKARLDDEAIIMRACKSSVKANNNLLPDDALSLIKELLTTENPYACPHGRPTMTKLGRQDVEKMFKRVL